MGRRPDNTANLLLVEDTDHRSVVTGLMRRAGIDWERADGSFRVWADIKGSAAEVLNHDVLQVELQTPGLKALGLIVDADGEIASRWSGIYSFCFSKFLNVPTDLPVDGLVVERADGLRFGAWIMPDNHSAGMVETFCRTLTNGEVDDIWEHAVKSANDARDLEAEWRDTHTDRAHLSTWLAWQDPPGIQMGTAIMKGKLDHSNQPAAAFIEWMKKLYGL